MYLDDSFVAPAPSRSAQVHRPISSAGPREHLNGIQAVRGSSLLHPS